MKNIKNTILGVILLGCSALFSQQEGVVTNYMYHMNAFNPAYVGVDGETVITSTFRQQWTGIEDAPSAQLVSFGTTLGNNLGMGVSILNRQTFVEKQTFTAIDFSYRLKISEKADLYMGLKAGGNFYSVNTEGLMTYNQMADPNISSISNFNPNIGIGALLKVDKWHFSLAAPRMLSTDRADNEDGLVTLAKARPHMYAVVGYDFLLNQLNKISLKPSALLRYVNGAPVSLDINTMLSFDNDFEIGATYRTDSAFAGLINFSIKKRLLLGYAYEVSTRKQLADIGNTNELLLRFKF
ncbi:type IX secretion system membrane protein, PorP/SprF family [Maribacter orientalis]|uniref:Type IX secretion system membrane protein, PorP/SprF family n=1 Tax=Maribacter orientalis TaxID=228957 RepID=A0A1H7GRW2_9FLAO|nr:type IX secretion system membrane protein PorP/SprF [Maribacter orientalis]SEK40769.1 type IX secretion system membrane protein, PorP/SprF family [Maribacter orientalis]